MNVQGPQIAPLFALLMMLFFAVFALGMMALVIVIWCKIFQKTGYGWAFGLLMLVPVANLVMLFVLAFGDWPVLRELQAYKQQQPQR